VTSEQEFRQARFGQSGHHSVDLGLSCVRKERLMADLAYVVLAIVVFAVLALTLRGLERL
jgi:hypothetical protein